MSDMTLKSSPPPHVLLFTAHSANAQCTNAHRLLELLIQQDFFDILCGKHRRSPILYSGKTELLI